MTPVVMGAGKFLSTSFQGRHEEESQSRCGQGRTGEMGEARDQNWHLAMQCEQREEWEGNNVLYLTLTP